MVVNRLVVAFCFLILIAKAEYLDGHFASNSSFNAAAVVLKLKGLDLDLLKRDNDLFGVQNTRELPPLDLKGFLISAGLKVDLIAAKKTSDITQALDLGKIVIIDTRLDKGRIHYQTLKKTDGYVFYDFPSLGEKLRSDFFTDLLSQVGECPALIVDGISRAEPFPFVPERHVQTQSRVDDESERRKVLKWNARDGFELPAAYFASNLPRGNYLVTLEIPLKAPADYAGPKSIEGSCSCFQGAKFSKEGSKSSIFATFDLSRYKNNGQFKTQLIVKLDDAMEPFPVLIEGEFNEEQHAFISLSSYDFGALLPGETKSVEAEIYAKDWNEFKVLGVEADGGFQARWLDEGAPASNLFLGEYKLIARLRLDLVVPATPPSGGKIYIAIKTDHKVYSKLYAEIMFRSRS